MHIACLVVPASVADIAGGRQCQPVAVSTRRHLPPVLRSAGASTINYKRL